MISSETQSLLSQAFPKLTWVNTVRAITEGLFVAEDYMASSPLLNSKLGRDLRGHIRRLGVMTRLYEYCQSGDLPFQGSIEKMPLGSWHWLEIKSGNALGHLVKTDGAFEFPEDTPNRQDKRLINQGELDLYGSGEGNILPMSTGLGEKTPLYAWLLYGVTRDGRLTHAAWGAPAPTSESWLGYIDILMASQNEIPTPPNTTPDPTQKLKFKDTVKIMLEEKETVETKGKDGDS